MSQKSESTYCAECIQISSQLLNDPNTEISHVVSRVDQIKILNEAAGNSCKDCSPLSEQLYPLNPS